MMNHIPILIELLACIGGMGYVLFLARKNFYNSDRVAALTGFIILAIIITIGKLSIVAELMDVNEKLTKIINRDVEKNEEKK